MKLIHTTEATGHVICHDITQIKAGERGRVAFKKGHIVKEEDIPVLLSMGKEHLYVWEKKAGFLHEDEAALTLYEICKDDFMEPTDIKEGKINIVAAADGLLKVDKKRLLQINTLGEIMIATIHGNFPVKKGDRLAGTRIIPLTIEEEKMDKARELAGKEPLLHILPFILKKAAVITTGSEVYHGRIKDAFGPVIRNKLLEYDVEVIGQGIVNDETEKITGQILEYIKEGAELILCTGGMSVDPDDTTPTAIKNTGAKLVSYGAPVLPGAMFLLAYYNDTPILGLPGCVMYSQRTIFDLILPRILANDKITGDELAALGHGGLCLNCEECTFPKCGFGR
ncbi:molybdopterin biosynthesis protein [Anaerocolumna cellulosilytica]|uniref:Molybdopterin molybdenumtransferase n=1 Tax=Anaerocolumna cellulosilytica TaxID=433286 RepID=A0A6S6R579_9FIRM|nr:molybdopterin-binding protein [Anaerocolumna cellulosilytica]MBB5198098.1 molybdenum cofactor synthesis domain-containing protein [Anaerocolumna cellulosilytica]BCJ96499.1 molybdopterin biosynthesis protein [Anaerocolumna cellulosilytica]